MPTGKYHFLPFLRRGLGNAIAEPRTGSSAHPLISTRVTLGDASGASYAAGTASLDLRMLGPGEITGIDTSLVVRTEPAALSRNFSPNYFPHVELAAPDLPWMFSPYAAESNSRLIPWLVLVCVRKSVASVEREPDFPLPVLRFDGADPAQELPDLSEAWAWAHTQVVLDDAPAGTISEIRANVQQVLARHPDRAVARLMCPRRLDPNTAYIAALVPTFRVGVEAGLGRPNTTESLDFAWQGVADPGPLPVYYSWEFTTAEADDFEALVRRLTPRAVPADAGLRDMDIRSPGFGMPVDSAAAKNLLLEGALWAPNAQRGAWPSGGSVNEATFRERLRQLLDAPATLAATTTTPTIAPPLYGQWHAARKTVPAALVGSAGPTERPVWFRDLNIDPRERTVAGFGTRVIQREQEQLMSLAWQQVGELRDANRIMIRTQFAREINGSLYRRHFSRMPLQWLIALTWRLHWRIFINGVSVAETLDKCPAVRAVGSPWTMRFARPGAGVCWWVRRNEDGGRARGLPTLVDDGANSPGTIDEGFPSPTDVTGQPCAAIDGGNPTTPPDDDCPDDDHDHHLHFHHHFFFFHHWLHHFFWDHFPHGGGSDPEDPIFDPQSPIVRSCTPTTVAEVAAVPGRPGFIVEPDFASPPSSTPGQDSSDAAALRIALRRRAEYYERISGIYTAQQAQPACDQIDLPAIRGAILAYLNPEVTAVARARGRIGWNEALWNPSDPLHFIMAHPKIDKPMYEGLRDLRQEYLLPGLDKIPAETITLVRTNPRFIESFMVGLNHEFGRELIWREYPTDQRGTIFRQFWDVEARIPQLDTSAPGYPAQRDARYDVYPIVGWRSEWGIGQNLEARSDNSPATPDPDNDGGRVVLLIRGELLRRYPGAIIYAVEAEWVPGTDNQRRPRELADGEDIALQQAFEKYPLFRGKLNPDVTFFGFDLTVSQARGSSVNDLGNEHPGWYFVIKQQPFDPRFGMDVASFGSVPPLARPSVGSGGTAPIEGSSPWDALAWSHFAPSQGALDALSHLSASPSAVTYPPGSEVPNPGPWPDWGFNASHIASITWQLPVRILIHADDMLQEPS